MDGQSGYRGLNLEQLNLWYINNVQISNLKKKIKTIWDYKLVLGRPLFRGILSDEA